ncbi:MAG: hypothetical protein DHS20C03_26980 [Minwuia thermotolerans]|nr:MAG: hypothetical protein DHS20C03_26980 [Minwuia thermotolerans]
MTRGTGQHCHHGRGNEQESADDLHIALDFGRGGSMHAVGTGDANMRVLPVPARPPYRGPGFTW